MKERAARAYPQRHRSVGVLYLRGEKKKSEEALDSPRYVCEKWVEGENIRMSIEIGIKKNNALTQQQTKDSAENMVEIHRTVV